ncbi:MAG: hypothetical protein ACHREM_06590 [Polyangiales bacterium]
MAQKEIDLVVREMLLARWASDTRNRREDAEELLRIGLADGDYWVKQHAEHCVDGAARIRAIVRAEIAEETRVAAELRSRR